MALVDRRTLGAQQQPSMMNANSLGDTIGDPNQFFPPPPGPEAPPPVLPEMPPIPIDHAGPVDPGGPPIHDTETPRESHPNSPGPDVTRPGGGNPGEQTPSMPTSPTPVASQSPIPFTPIPAPGGVSRPAPPMFGSAGGLMGGGIGLPSSGGPIDQSSNPDILKLMQMLGIQ